VRSKKCAGVSKVLTISLRCVGKNGWKKRSEMEGERELLWSRIQGWVEVWVGIERISGYGPRARNEISLKLQKII
jgi:hypothetical protein